MGNTKCKHRQDHSVLSVDTFLSWERLCVFFGGWGGRCSCCGLICWCYLINKPADYTGYRLFTIAIFFWLTGACKDAFKCYPTIRCKVEICLESGYMMPKIREITFYYTDTGIGCAHRQHTCNWPLFYDILQISCWAYAVGNEDMRITCYDIMSSCDLSMNKTIK